MSRAAVTSIPSSGATTGSKSWRETDGGKEPGGVGWIRRPAGAASAIDADQAAALGRAMGTDGGTDSGTAAQVPESRVGAVRPGTPWTDKPGDDRLSPLEAPATGH